MYDTHTAHQFHSASLSINTPRIPSRSSSFLLETPAWIPPSNLVSLDGVLESELDEVVNVGLPVRVGLDSKSESSSLRSVREGEHGRGAVRLVPLGPVDDTGVRDTVEGVVGVEGVDEVDEVVDCGDRIVSLVLSTTIMGERRTELVVESSVRAVVELLVDLRSGEYNVSTGSIVAESRRETEVDSRVEGSDEGSGFSSPVGVGPGVLGLGGEVEEMTTGTLEDEVSSERGDPLELRSELVEVSSAVGGSLDGVGRVEEGDVGDFLCGRVGRVVVVDVVDRLLVGDDGRCAGEGEERSLVVAVSRDHGDLGVRSVLNRVEGGLGEEDTVNTREPGEVERLLGEDTGGLVDRVLQG